MDVEEATLDAEAPTLDVEEAAVDVEATTLGAEADLEGDPRSLIRVSREPNTFAEG